MAVPVVDTSVVSCELQSFSERRTYIFDMDKLKEGVGLASIAIGSTSSPRVACEFYSTPDDPPPRPFLPHS